MHITHVFQYFLKIGIKGSYDNILVGSLTKNILCDCGSLICENVVNIFICANIDDRIRRAVEEYNIPKEKAAETILRQDKRRANYYNFHANEKWGNVNNYDLSIRTDFGGIDHAVKCIKAFLEV